MISSTKIDKTSRTIAASECSKLKYLVMSIENLISSYGSIEGINEIAEEAYETCGILRSKIDCTLKSEKVAGSAEKFEKEFSPEPIRFVEIAPVVPETSRPVNIPTTTNPEWPAEEQFRITCSKETLDQFTGVASC